MSPEQEPLTPFERNARTVLEESVQRVDAHTRSRLIRRGRRRSLPRLQDPPGGAASP